MLSLEKYCLSQAPFADEYINIYSFTITSVAMYGKWPLVPDMDPVSGDLIIKDSSGDIILTTNRLVDNYKTLLDFFLIAKMYDGILKFYIDNFRIIVYLYKPAFKDAIYVPSLTTFTCMRTKLKPSIAKNEQIRTDYNSNFQIDLYNYQQNNVEWMISIEELTNTECNVLRYPKLKEAALTRVRVENALLLYNNNTHHLYPEEYEEHVEQYTLPLCGGLLCDEVGLGKTFSMYGLIINTLGRQVQYYEQKPSKRQLAAELETFEEIPDPEEIVKYSSTATLILCPTRLVGQWKDELAKFAIPLNDLRVYTISSIVNYRKLTAAELCNADIVIVSHQFLTNTNYHRHQGDPEYGNFSLADFYWKRMILDEGHEILHEYSKSSAIRTQIYKLRSKYRWICTGTPFPHDYSNLDYYLFFLSNFKYNLNYFYYFNSNVIKTFLKQNTHCNTYQNVTEQIYIPPITQVTVLLKQDPVERAIYVNATGDTTRMIQLCTNILASDLDSSIVNDKVTSLQVIKRRMSNYYQSEIDACRKQIQVYQREWAKAKELYDAAGDLYEVSSQEWKTYRSTQKTAMNTWGKNTRDTEGTIASMKARKNLFDDFEERVKRDPCVICYEEMTDAVLTKCSHIFCRACMKRVIDDSPHNIKCPLCRTYLKRGTDIGYLLEETNIDKNTDYYRHVQKWGTKMAWLVQYLTHILRDSDNRVIIFSQWKRMLSLIGKVLTKNKIKQAYLKGTTSQLAKNINRFKYSQDYRIIMLSSETCSSGSNLTEATHIILVDTVNGSAHTAKAIEDQAIGRAARLGQTRNVQVVRLIMEKTIEYDYYKQNIDQHEVKEVQGGENVYV